VDPREPAPAERASDPVAPDRPASKVAREVGGARPPAGPVEPVLLREAVGQVVPDGFHHDVVQVRVIIPHPVTDVWAWLDDPATFADGQGWPFAAEFHHPPGTPAAAA